ncbi:DUF1622 domain-containing protein [Bradyrhizobium sp. WYCCWR 13022]|uniref:DUF1622 domain-containing protein n=1 Tax=unclassified Bradyrhizobium TaxID=2631580 RepID=UPI00263B5B0B|nr:DUF1622 domain-containing protein [Bradyrhizobium sp. WYCCWR 13022]MDN4982411.1 DUF1622 domain-containing protein [Bradyrhizobium sp. WYCCWR 13022]
MRDDEEKVRVMSSGVDPSPPPALCCSGSEVLVAADIAKTIAIELTFANPSLLAGFVIVRTFLSWTLEIECAPVFAHR